MLGNQSLNRAELLELMREGVTTFCRNRDLPIIPVKYGTTKARSGLEFDIYNPAVLLSDRLSSRLATHSEYARVWYLLSALAHETTHYQQYIRLRRKRIPIRVELFDEEEAILAGQQHADNSIGKYTPKQINPILADLGASALAGFGLAAGWKGFEWTRSKIKGRKKNPVKQVIQPKPVIEDVISRLERRLNNVSSLRGRVAEDKTLTTESRQMRNELYDRAEKQLLRDLHYWQGELKRRKNPREPWQMTRAEYAQSVRARPDSERLTNAHTYYVNKAVSEGKPVPPEVLKDYPGLRKNPWIYPWQKEKK